MKTQINLKIDVAIKTEAQKRAKELGLTLSAVINTTLSQFARTGELHVTAEPEIAPKFAALLREGRAAYERGEVSGPFNTVEDSVNHLQNVDKTKS